LTARRRHFPTFSKLPVLGGALGLLFVSPAAATWSVIAVDQHTNEVAISSATCFPQQAFAGTPVKGLLDIQAIVVPGKGVAAAQARADATRQNQRLIYEEIDKGTDPEQIVEQLRADPDLEQRQFGILDLRGRSAAFSGRRIPPIALDRQGGVPGTGISFSIQGNTLRNERVVTSAVRAFEQANGSLTDRVMAAMEAGDANGGDRRCTCETEPKPDAPCTRKTAHVAYILCADASDKPGVSYNDGAYAMYISATEADIRPDEDANPVKTLRMRYARWKQGVAREDPGRSSGCWSSAAFPPEGGAPAHRPDSAR
jgi:uncharacterized Ntn-hydrolase superfamily protein